MPQLQVKGVKYSEVPERLWGRSIDEPLAGQELRKHTLCISGWVLGRGIPVKQVEITCGDTLLTSAHCDVPRRDVFAAFPDADASVPCGYRAGLSLLGLPCELSLTVRAVLEDGTREHIGVVTVRRSTLVTHRQSSLAPLMLTSLGRTGTTWVVRLLGQHPQIVSYRPFESEPHVVTYWMSVLRDLAEPSSYYQAFAATNITDRHWWLGANASDGVPVIPPFAADPSLEQWMGGEGIETLAAYCQGRIDEFYERATASEQKQSPRYFIEKFIPEASLAPLVQEVYPQAKEVFLVRDFRDMLCSMVSFNVKQGFQSFNQHLATDDLDFVRITGKGVHALLANWQARAKQACLLRYEDLIRWPKETLTKIFDYLQLDSSPATIEQTLNRATNLRPDLQKKHQTSRDPLGSIGRWRTELPADLRAACGKEFGEAMMQFGYKD